MYYCLHEGDHDISSCCLYDAGGHEYDDVYLHVVYEKEEVMWYLHVVDIKEEAMIYLQVFYMKRTRSSSIIFTLPSVTQLNTSPVTLDLALWFNCVSQNGKSSISRVHFHVFINTLTSFIFFDNINNPIILSLMYIHINNNEQLSFFLTPLAFK